MKYKISMSIAAFLVPLLFMYVGWGNPFNAIALENQVRVHLSNELDVSQEELAEKVISVESVYSLLENAYSVQVVFQDEPGVVYLYTKDDVTDDQLEGVIQTNGGWKELLHNVLGANLYDKFGLDYKEYDVPDLNHHEYEFVHTDRGIKQSGYISKSDEVMHVEK